IFTTIKRRFPSARITLFPVLVQGSSAPASITSAIDKVNELGFIDVMIIGRGGGSIEELWAFNEEMVARRIFASTVPVISAVGHETDYTIADFVADVRAPTPTGAGELSVPHFEELSERIAERQLRLRRAMLERTVSKKERLKRLRGSYAFRYPSQLVRQKEQELDRLLDRHVRENKRLVRMKADRLFQANRGLRRHHPEDMFKTADEQRYRLAKTLQREMRKIHKQKAHEFRQTVSKLNVLSPLNIMERGFSLTYDEGGHLIKSTKQVQPSDLVKVRLKDGQLECHVWGIEESETND
ncbi:MAG TPA: exodeoxyribonuclease VII large subunit, partial [Bacillales bacterium]|nr:exodeoxyribonuclease VII large subunit [Bacillales bacterium]